MWDKSILIYIILVLPVTASLPQKEAESLFVDRRTLHLLLPYRTEFLMVRLVDDSPIHVLENGATQDRICFMSGSDPIFPRLIGYYERAR